DGALSARGIYRSQCCVSDVFRDWESVSILPDSLFIRTCPRQHDGIGADRIIFWLRPRLDGSASRSGGSTSIRVRKIRNSNIDYQNKSQYRNRKPIGQWRTREIPNLMTCRSALSNSRRPAGRL